MLYINEILILRLRRLIIQRVRMNLEYKILTIEKKINYKESFAEPFVKNSEPFVKKLIIFDHNLGGGTATFINFLISYGTINNHNYILIKPRVESSYYVYDSSTKELKCSDSFQLIQLLKSYEGKRQVVINSIIGFDQSIKIYLKYCKNDRKILILHDYSLCSEIYNPYYHEIRDEGKNENMNIFNTNDILIASDYRNIELLYICCDKKNKSFFPKEIYVFRWPDYTSPTNGSEKRIKVKNEKIKGKKNILVIGYISTKKGSQIISYVHNFLNDKYNLFVAGGISDPSIPQQSYGSFSAFNSILVKFKPHMILFTSIFLETWCYALTLGMLTQLPIIYYNNGDSVTVNRLKQYRRSYPFDSIDQLEHVISTVKEKKHFELISGDVDIDDNWAQLFSTNLM